MRPDSSYLVLDIETIIDPGLPFRPTSDGSLPSAPHHQIVVIGVCWFDKSHVAQRFGVLGDGRTEAGMLADFVHFFESRRPALVTWNGRSFDLPVIAARCLKHGVQFAHYYQERDLRYRFSPEAHFDLMDYMSDYGASHRSRLDTIARLIGLPGKRGVEGKDVGPLMYSGKVSEVQAYCLSDVIQTAAIFLRLQFLRGKLDLDGYRSAMLELFARADADPRMAAMMEAVDREQVLLRPHPLDPIPPAVAPATHDPAGDTGEPTVGREPGGGLE